MHHRRRKPAVDSPGAILPSSMSASGPHGPPVMRMTDQPYVHSYFADQRPHVIKGIDSGSRKVRGIRTLLTEEIASICPFEEILAREEQLRSTVPVTLPEEDLSTTQTSILFTPSCSEAPASPLGPSDQEPPRPTASSTVNHDSRNTVLPIADTMSTPAEAPILFPSVTTKVTEPGPSEAPSDLMVSMIEQKVPNIRTECSVPWPELTLDNINTTFSVVGALKSGNRLRIVDDRILAVDDSWGSSIYRMIDGQSRERNLSFMGHLFNETKRHVVRLINDIRRGVDVDTKISELDTTICKMVVFMHNYPMISEPYVTCTGTHAKFEVILDSFRTFRHTFIRDVMLTR